MVGQSRRRRSQPAARRFRRYLSAEDETRIEAAIADLERRSAAELAVAVAHRSSSYAAYPALWAACLALFGGWIVALIEPDETLSHLILIQELVLIGAMALLYLTPLGTKLVPAAVQRARAAAMARVEFTRLVHKRTRGKNGILLFVSRTEHYVEIIADDAVAAEIAQDRWQQAVDDFRSRAKRMKLADNLVLLIGECAAVLAARFPAKPGQVNELPDTVQEI